MQDKSGPSASTRLPLAAARLAGMTTLRVIVCREPLRGSRDDNPSGDRTGEPRLLTTTNSSCALTTTYKLLTTPTAHFHTVNSRLYGLKFAQNRQYHANFTHFLRLRQTLRTR